jgi:hypothetical protein
MATIPGRTMCSVPSIVSSRLPSRSFSSAWAESSNIFLASRRSSSYVWRRVTKSSAKITKSFPAYAFVFLYPLTFTGTS